MTDRLLCPAERMTDVFDRASTLNFTVVAHVRGAVREAELRAALARLEERHPLLRAGIERAGKRSRFVAHGAAPIELIMREGTRDEVHALAERTLQHREWPGPGPRAELTYVRHGAQDFSLLLCLHHVISDGSSGFLAMRDLLAFLGGAAHDSTPLPSPGSAAFMPRGHGGLWDYARSLAMIVRSSRAQKPRRLHNPRVAKYDARVAHYARVVLSPDDTAAVALRARRAGATVHGAVCAALAEAIRDRLGVDSVVERVLHPVCLRRYLRARTPNAPSPGQAVGCYISSVETDVRVQAGSDLSLLARAFSQGIQQKKAEGIPLLTAPLAGPLLADRFEAALDKLRTLGEQQLMLNTFSVTNLGVLETQLEVAHSYGSLALDDIFFVAAGSILGQLGGSVTTFGGALSLQLSGVSPSLAREQTEALLSRASALLTEYARGAHQAA